MGSGCTVYEYTMKEQAAQFEDISSTGTNLNLDDDDYKYHEYVSIPFTFSFYCTAYDQISICSDGWISFEDEFPYYINDPLPSFHETVDTFIAPFWDDLNPSSGGAVYYQIKGSAPNRRVIIQWENVPQYENIGAVTFQAILYEGSNQILFQYQDVVFGNASYDYGASATVGIQIDSCTAVQYSYNEPIIQNGLAIKFSPSDSAPVVGRVPDTGQTESYTGTFGEDSDYSINPRSYTKLDASGNALPGSATSWVMVRDNVTSLIWEMKEAKDGSPNYSNPHDADNTYTMDPSPRDSEYFIYALNTAKFGSFSDWRMPTVKELFSIIDKSRYNPAVNTSNFPVTIGSQYGSLDCGLGASSVHFGTGYTETGYGPYYVRAVRGKKEEYGKYLIDNADGTVTDVQTGLMWQQLPVFYEDWEEALIYCENLALAGYDDWRLPSVHELLSLYSSDDGGIDDFYFPDFSSSPYWSSTTFASDTTQAWHIYFDDNGDGVKLTYDLKVTGDNVIAVRGGRTGPSGSPLAPTMLLLLQ